MTESEILRIWNGPTSVCNKAKILQFAADLEAKRAERPTNEKDDEQALRVWNSLDKALCWKDVPVIFARRLRAESAQECECPVEGHVTGCPNDMLTRFSALVAKPAAPDRVSVRADVVAFLKGAGPLDGVWYGETPPGKHIRYWWRKYLPNVETK